jgi:hypothetical protein
MITATLSEDINTPLVFIQSDELPKLGIGINRINLNSPIYQIYLSIKEWRTSQKEVRLYAQMLLIAAEITKYLNSLDSSKHSFANTDIEEHIDEIIDLYQFDLI